MKQEFDDWLIETARMINAIPPEHRQRVMELFREKREALGLGPAAEAVMIRLLKPGMAEMIVDLMEGGDCSVKR
ncbi:MAG: hypothetical protein K6T65_10605 [Peptococcaceae bacterium]|nr:hypothetical protein [Peptococcaceae bacterium]